MPERQQDSKKSQETAAKNSSGEDLYYDSSEKYILGPKTFHRVLDYVEREEIDCEVNGKDGGFVPANDFLRTEYQEALVAEFSDGSLLCLEAEQERREWTVPEGHDKSQPVRLRFEFEEGEIPIKLGKKSVAESLPGIEDDDLAGAESAFIELMGKIAKALEAKSK